MRERELRRVLPAEADLPGLDDAIPGVELGPPEQQRVEDRYLDTVDLRLARWGVTLRWRKGTGWTLKLPHPKLDSGGLDRDELVLAGKASAPPARALALVSGFARSEPLLPVALLSKDRTAGAGSAPSSRPGRWTGCGRSCRGWAGIWVGSATPTCWGNSSGAGWPPTPRSMPTPLPTCCGCSTGSAQQRSAR